MTVQHLDLPGSHVAPGLIGQIVTNTGRRLIHRSGQVAWGRLRQPHRRDHAAQAAVIARNITTALAAAGAGPEDIVKEVIYAVDYTPTSSRPSWVPSVTAPAPRPPGPYRARAR
ncbi:Rid family hydrolase [Streptomyces sp. 24-1644]|uniref:Rid family hydrolase n=1 Tax=Streptomyces sp. 24-1644 TaxID=3457315 RepID=UPI003FA769A6